MCVDVCTRSCFHVRMCAKVIAQCQHLQNNCTYKELAALKDLSLTQLNDQRRDYVDDNTKLN